MARIAIADCVESIVGDIDSAGLDRVVICGHSMAGLIVPNVVATFGSSRVVEMVLAAASVPPHGTSVLEALGGPLGWYVRRAAAARNAPAEMPRLAARLAFCNGMTRRQRQSVLPRIRAESIALVTEKVLRDQLPDEISRTWILTRRDRTLSVKSQRRSIEAVGGVDTVIPMNTCHDLMVSQPQRLAEILIERCRLHAQSR